MSRYGDLLRSAQGGVIEPIYMLAGSDPFLQDHFIAEVAAKFLPDGMRKHVYTLDDDKAEDILADLRAYSLFDGRQLVVLLQAQKIAGAPRDELLAYAEAPNPEKCLFLVTEDYQPTKGLQKKLSTKIAIVDCRPPFPDKIKSWAQYYARQQGHTIESSALEELIAAVGDSVGHVTSELDKIFSRLELGTAVTLAMVEEQVAHDLAYHLWHLQVAMAERDTAQSLIILTMLLNYGVDGTRVVQSLGVLFNQLLYLQTGTTSDGVYTGLNKPVTAKLSGMRSLYPVADAPAILKRLLQADLLLKSTSSAPASVLVPLIVGITKGTP